MTFEEDFEKNLPGLKGKVHPMEIIDSFELESVSIDPRTGEMSPVGNIKQSHKGVVMCKDILEYCLDKQKVREAIQKQKDKAHGELKILRAAHPDSAYKIIFQQRIEQLNILEMELQRLGL